MWDFHWTKWHWDTLCFPFFGFPLSVSLQKYSLLIPSPITAPYNFQQPTALLNVTHKKIKE
jgi:hypothetical protein